MEIWSNEKVNRRTKERRISFVIEKVSLWRKLYNGVEDSSGNLVRYSLDEAASKIGISKKSLDDYLLQLRFGKRYGFDFNKYKEDKIGKLRQFVKKQKSEMKGKMQDKSSMEDDAIMKSLE
jgi:cell division protein FtsI/penicillin-binding protein 2